MSYLVMIYWMEKHHQCFRLQDPILHTYECDVSC